MVEFWLDNPIYLINQENLNLNNITAEQKKIKTLNLIAMIGLIGGLTLVYIKRRPIYFAMGVCIMTFTILINSNKNILAPFTAVTDNKMDNSNNQNYLDTAFDTGAYLVNDVNSKDPSGLNNLLYINQGLNFNKGDIIALSVNGKILEVNIISDVKYTTSGDKTVLVLLNRLKNNYQKSSTKILKVSDSAPDIIPPPDGNVSIQNAKSNFTSDPLEMAANRFPKSTLPNQNRNDWNLEQSSMIPGTQNNYVYQGQPYGDLKCRNSTVDNPMGTINVTEYSSPPTMYGTCNVAEQTNGVYNDNLMTSNQEATVSQRVDDLLFHKGNAQSRFSPMPIDTLPDNQASFANFCYNQPTNMVNVKYASIFVNDPEKYKLVAGLAKATGTEGGSGNR